MLESHSENVARSAFPSAIIVGVGRCGTTSLFRYLGHSKEIRLSSKKELDFLVDEKGKDKTFFSKKYAEAFGVGAENFCRIEASPRYSLEAAYTAEAIKRFMPDTKIVILVRDPVDRMISVYRAIRRSGNIRDDVSIEDFVRFAFGDLGNISNYPHLNDRYKKALSNGCYIDVLKAYEEKIDSNNIHVMFLEELERNPAKELAKISLFLGIDCRQFENLSYEIENPAIDVRSPTLYKFALQVNAKLEPIFNRVPRIRSFLRRIHSGINGSRGHRSSMDAVRFELENFYRPYNIELRQHLLSKYRIVEFPTWLSICSED